MASQTEKTKERRQLQAEEGKKAWAEYLAQVEATRAKTERLRAERLSRAAAAGSHKPA